MSDEYPSVIGDGYGDDTMPNNVRTLAEAIVGHKIVSVVGPTRDSSDTVFVLDNGKRVRLAATDDCCAYTDMEAVIPRLPELDHVVTRVEVTEDYTRWHILADAGEVLELQVGWSYGNPFYYAYGFTIYVENA